MRTGERREKLMDGWKQFLLKLSRRQGWDVKRYNVSNSEWLRLVMTLRSHHVTMTLDIGANTGQFAVNLRRAGFGGQIVSFEPLSGAHAELTRRASRDTKWTVAPKLALSDREGVVTVNVSRNSVSSSLLPMMNTHIQADSASRYIGEERVACARLDQVALEYLSPDDIVFLKIDVQGYEAKVLGGAEGVLSRIACVRLELSLVQLYEGQALYAEMIEWMNSNGFSLWGLDPAFVDPNNGKMLQVDGLFCRSEVR